MLMLLQTKLDDPEVSVVGSTLGAPLEKSILYVKGCPSGESMYVGGDSNLGWV